MFYRFCIISLFLHCVFFSFAQEVNSFSCNSCNIKWTENKNQWDERIRYLLELDDDRMILENNGFTFDFKDHAALENIYKKAKGGHPELSAEERIVKGHVYKVSFLNSRRDVQLQPCEPIIGHRNYFLGKDKSKWASNIKEYRRVIYKNLYSGIDANLYGQDGSFKYDFIVQPNTEVQQIQMLYYGVENISLSDGNLVVKTSVNEVIEQKPFAYQMIEGKQQEVECNFVLSKRTTNDKRQTTNSYTVTFEFPNGYDKSKTLVIDPTLIFSTYSGSTADNWGFTATYDFKGNTYSGGVVFNVDATYSYPVSLGAYQTTFGGGTNYMADVGIIKYDSSGQNRLYATYLGGAANEMPHSFVVNNNNELMILGTTSSLNFPTTTTAYDTSFNGGTSDGINSISFSNGSDIFVAKLSEDGSQLLASTFIGGSGNDGLNTPSPLHFNYGDQARGDITVDANNNCIVASCTQSGNFPVSVGAFQNNFAGGGQDGCVFKLDNDLKTLVWSSYLGGSNLDAAYSIAQDDEGKVFVAGGTTSSDFPASPGAWYPSFQGVADGFITHISQNGENIINSTFFGDATYDQCFFVQLDRENKVYVLGQTQAPDSTFIFNAPYSKANSGQFIAKLNYTLTNLDFSTVFGDGNFNSLFSPTAFLVDVCEKIYVSGWGDVAGFEITSDAFQSTSDDDDFYLMVIDGTASSLVYATFFGGSTIWEHVDGGTSRFDKKGIVYQSVCGACGGQFDTTITTPGVWSRSNKSSNCNNMVFRLNFDFPTLLADFDANPVIGCAPLTVNFNNKSSLVINSQWLFGDDSVSAQINPVHTFSKPGIYNVMLIVQDTFTCNPNDTIIKQIRVMGDTVYFLPSDTVCEGETVQIGLSSGVDTTLTYRWIPSANLSDTIIPNPFATPDTTTTYTLIVSNGFCADTVMQQIFTYSINAGTDTSICKGASIQIGITPEANVDYSWSPSINLSDDSIANPFATPDSTSQYILKMQTQSCVRYDTVIINVIFDSLYAIPSQNICKGQGVQLGINPGGITSFKWTPTSGLSDSTITNPIAFPDSTIAYRLEFSNGICTDTILQDVIVYVANAGVDSAICPGEIVQLGGLPQIGATYSWSPIFGLDFPANSNPTASVSSSITYYLTVDNGVCQIFDTVNILVLSNSASTINYYICNDDSVQLGMKYNGNINLQWTPTIYLSDSTITNPFAKPDTSITYTLFLSNGNCADTLILPVVVNSAQAGKDTTICKGQSVLLGIPPQDGVSWYWWTPNTFLDVWWQSTATSTPDTSISYEVRMALPTCQRRDTVRVEVIQNSYLGLTDYEMCSGDSVRLGIDPKPNVNIVWTPSTGLNDSTISNPYTLTDSAYIRYTLFITKDDGTCTDTILNDVYVYHANAGMNVTICKGDTVQIGMANETAIYLWTPASTLNDSTVSDPLAFPDTATTYIVSVTTAAKSCFRYDTVLVAVLQNKNYDLPADTICKGDTIQIGLDNIPFQTLSWTPSNSLSNANIPNPLAFPDTATLYRLQISNGKCEDTVNQLVAVVFTNAGMDTVICEGESIELGMENQGVSYLWTPNIYLNDNTVSNPIASPVLSVTYFVEVTAKNCMRTDTVNVGVIPVSIFAGTDTLICFGDTVQLGIANSNQIYSWTPTGTLSDSTISNPLAFPGQTTKYFITATNAKCALNDSVLVEVEDSIGSDFQTYIELSCQGIKVLFVNHSRKAASYYWDFGDGDTSNLPTPWHFYNENKPYSVTLIVEDDSRCAASITKEIYPYEDYVRHHIPNVFTPNNDGQNDCFQLGLAELPDGCYYITIYNRWGEIVFESHKPNNCWNGKIRQTQEDVAEGAYFYLLKIRQLTFTGFVEVVR